MNPSGQEPIEELLSRAPILPVLDIATVADAVPLARTLVEAGLPVLEITLRREHALAVIETLARDVPEAIVGAGTVLTAAQFAQVADAGARFAISPGATERLYAAAADARIPYLPAVATASELMRGLEHGYRCFKFFPAQAAGGVGALRGFAGPFPQARFCPTGGIDADSAPAYLALDNVVTVGGSWMAPGPALAANDWSRIGALAQAAARLAMPRL